MTTNDGGQCQCKHAWHVVAVASLVQEVFDEVAGAGAVAAVLCYLRAQRLTSLADLQV